MKEAQYVNGNTSYNFKPNNNVPTYYTPALRNHENFSYFFVLVVRPDIWSTSTKHQSKKKGKEIEMNFTNGNGLDLTYDTNLFGGLNEKMDYLNDENTATE